MTKEAWIEHIRNTEGILPPSKGGSKGDWDYALDLHKSMACRECAARNRTRMANMNRKIKDGIMRDMGLVKVRGALGGTYYE
jgi:hypothetical protein